MQSAHANDVLWVHALKRKILFGILALVALSIALAMIFIVVTLRTSLLHDSARQTQQLGDVVKSTLRVMMARRDPAVLQETFDAMRQGSDSLVGAFIVDAKGTIVYSTDRGNIGKVLDRHREESCIGCHRTLTTAPTAPSIIVKTSVGVKAQRNISVIYNVVGYRVRDDRSDILDLYKFVSTGITGACRNAPLLRRRPTMRCATNWRGRSGTMCACVTSWHAWVVSAPAWNASAIGCAARTNG